MADLLFEVGIEELPPSLINDLLNQIKNNLITELNNKNISVKEDQIKTFSTPRRIAFNITNLPEEQPVKNIEIKGPPKNKAYDENGKPTDAAFGFIKKNNISLDKLKIKLEKDIEYVYANITIGGNKTIDLLKDIFPKSLLNTTCDKMMKWGSYSEKFIRPIRWTVAILDKNIVDFSFAGIKSSNFSLGHRFMGLNGLKNAVAITNPNEYIESLLKVGVIVEREKRKEKIIQEINKQASLVNGKVILDLKLLEEVVNITENPGSILCSFDEDFLNLPDFIIETVLKKHQRYFVISNSKEKLLPYFIVITNGTEKENINIQNNIKKGNEKVARARLNDAKFFFDEDLKKPFTFEERVNSLSKITFQKGLGTIEEKIYRIENLALFIYEELNKKTKLPINKEDVQITSKLCKLDLTTQIVFEMPELQGKIGKVYAIKNGYSEQIAKGIEEHYLITSDNNLLAQIVGIADKLDNLICLFAINKIPTSSADPFALRGQINWIVNNIEIIENTYNLNFEITKILNHYTDKIASKKVKELLSENVILKIKEFIVERLKLKFYNIYAGKNDLIDAVFSAGNPLNNIGLVKKNIELLINIFSNPTEEDRQFLTAAKRIIRIIDLKQIYKLQTDFLKSTEELNLLNEFNNIESKKYFSINDYYNDLKSTTNSINVFFDKVLVNDSNPSIKEARQALLIKGKNLFEKICDFNKIVERN